MEVTLRQLEVFVAVAESLHFGRAADRLEVSQPVVSAEVARLERRLGGRLFERSPRSVELTELGSELLEPARTALGAATAFADLAARRTRQRPAQVRVACTPSVVNELLPAVLRDLSGTDVELQEVFVETGGALAPLVAGEVDLAVGRFLPSSAEVTTMTLGEEELVVVAAAGLRLDDPVALRDLADLPLLIWSRETAPAYYDHVIGVCRERGLDPVVRVGHVRYLGARSYLIAEGTCFGLAPVSVVASLPAELTARYLSQPARVPLDVAWRRGHGRAEVGVVAEAFRKAMSAR